MLAAVFKLEVDVRTSLCVWVLGLTLSKSDSILANITLSQ